MVGKCILTWMVEQDRTVTYLARRADLDVDVLVSFITGDLPSETQSLEALEVAMGLPRGELQAGVPEDTPDRTPVDSLQCFTVKEVAERMHVSEDVVRQEMAHGVLPFITVGVRSQRIPREALEERLARWRTDPGGDLPTRQQRDEGPN